jgi:hypothetical protein
LWVKSRFSLANYLGSRVQIRWVAQGWEFDFDLPPQDYQTYGRGWENSLHDDGWWVDDIAVTGAITEQASPQADNHTPPASVCPVNAAAGCDETQGDRGFVVGVVAGRQRQRRDREG